MKVSVIGYPRIGELRELKYAAEKYFNKSITAGELQDTARRLRVRHWRAQQENNIDFISSNDFSLYDNMLDTAALLNVVPERYQRLGLPALDEYFAMARGYQGEHGDVKALAMKKWFNTNYHYMVPEIEDTAVICLAGTKPFDEYAEAKNLGIETKPAVCGAFSFLKLSRFIGEMQIQDFIPAVVKAYTEILKKFAALGAEWVQFDEPVLVTDLDEADIRIFGELYDGILSAKGNTKVLLQTYFGDIRDCYRAVTAADFDGIGLDFTEGKKTLELIREHGFPEQKYLFAGVVNGKNIWRNNYPATVKLVKELSGCGRLVLSTSCSLLHVPYTLDHESGLSDEQKRYLAFAQEKLMELEELKQIVSGQEGADHPLYRKNEELFAASRNCADEMVQGLVSALLPADFIRCPDFGERAAVQRAKLQLPLLPTTTIGSFPQTGDVKKNRSDYKKGKITDEQYVLFNKERIAEWVARQEQIGLDVLVHGEFERNDMVEYFGEQLEGFLFTEKAWVQSYGTRCVKPPIIWGDISRRKPMTVAYSVFAQSLTARPMKGMLTGPVTILNWSFPREDIALKDCVMQIALAIRGEVLALESNGIGIIQIDEAALREKLPLRKSDWESEYLSWAIPAFRLVHSGVRPETQIHTHMCYSEFSDIIRSIDDMDADVITFEATRSDLEILKTLQESDFRTAVGPGVYDIHSPRIPAAAEIEAALWRMLEYIPKEKLWVNPDCGLKTRGTDAAVSSLEHLAAAAKAVRKELDL